MRDFRVTIVTEPAPSRESRSETTVHFDYTWGSEAQTIQSAIVDEGGPPRFVTVAGRRRKVARTCMHRKLDFEVEPAPIPEFRMGIYEQQDIKRVSGVIPNFMMLPLSSPQTIPTITPTEADEAFVSLKEIMPTTVSVPNFLLEVDDIPKLVQGPMATLKDAIYNLGHRGLMRRRKSLRTAGQAKLYMDFGLKPLYDDIERLLASFDVMNERIRFLQRTHGLLTPVVRKLKDYTIPADVRKTGRQAIFQYPGYGALYQDTTVHWAAATVKRRIGAYMFQEVVGLDNALFTLPAILDVWGFNRPLSVIWEAIPFSWLVDYVTNVGDVLETIEPLVAFPGEVRLISGYTQVKTELKCEASYEVFRQPTGGSPMHSGSLGTTTLSHFDRVAGIPTSAGMLLSADKGHMSLNQYSNLYAALTRG